MAHPYQDLQAKPAQPMPSHVPGAQIPAAGAQIFAQPACPGLLPSTLREPFMLVVRTARSLGLETGSGCEDHDRPWEYGELPHIEATLVSLKQAIHRLGAPCAVHLSLLDQLVQTQLVIAGIKGRAHAPADYRGAERRGVQAPSDTNPTR